MSDPTRLHITPLTPDLLSAVLGPSLVGNASNISFHTIPTFPENDYGFLDLPLTQANKVIAKLNGAILRGRKMKIEPARSKKRLHEKDDEIQNAAKSSSEQAHKRSKSIKNGNGLIEGHEISHDRKVKRGWTEASHDRPSTKKSKDKSKSKSKRQPSSKYTEKQELLFRTKLPPSKADMDPEKRTRKGKFSTNSPTLVHEFEKTTIQPSFLRDNGTSSARAAEFVDSVGWVDEKGNVVDEEPVSLKRRRNAKAVGLRIDLSPLQPAREDPTTQEATSSSGSSSQSSASANGVDAAPGTEDESVNFSSSSSDPDMDDTPKTKSNTRSLPQIQVELAPKTPPKVHPLEALFKKPKAPSSLDSSRPALEIETSFSFFGDRETGPDDELPPMPVTPFTSQDIRARGVRSAAPTPDTAHPSRFASFANALAARGDLGVHDGNEDDDDSEHGDKNLPTAENSGSRPQSEFEKRFWAERGQNNRAWKERSRASRKEQRQLENRLRRSRNTR